MDAPAFGRAIRHQWLLEEGMAYLNHGSFGATLRRVLRAQDGWRLRMERQPMRFFLDVYEPALRAVAGQLADFVGACGDDLALVENATSGVNAVLRSLDLRPGDEVVTTQHLYPAVAFTLGWVLERSGAVQRQVQLPFPLNDPAVVLERIEAAITPRTRLVVVDHITSATSLVLPVADIVALCRDRGLRVLIDGAHGPGMLELDLPALGADWYTGNCHKWLCGAKGAGFLWANPERSDATEGLHPAVLSNYTGRGFPREFDWVGTRDTTSWLSLDEALAFQREIGPRRIREHNRNLVLRGARTLADLWGSDLPCPESMVGSIVSMPCPVAVEPTEAAARELASWLWRTHRIEPMPVAFGGRMWIRISAHLYNEPGEYEQLGRALLDAPHPRA